jgi:hypothetical protein
MGENCVFSILHTEFDINVTPKIKCILLKLGYNYIEAELNKLGIRMLTYSADGDSREMKMMRQVLNLGALPPRLSRQKKRQKRYGISSYFKKSKIM